MRNEEEAQGRARMPEREITYREQTRNYQLSIRNFTLLHGCARVKTTHTKLTLMLSAGYCRKNVSNDILFQNFRKKASLMNQ